MNIGFDVISDLNLGAEDEFDWEGKATSLYLIIAGNISHDLKIVHQTLYHLSKFYQGIFYIPGSLEFESMNLVKYRNSELLKVCRTLKNVSYLHKHVVIINGIAFLGCNGWYANKLEVETDLEEIHLYGQNVEDVHYLKHSINKLQLHLDVKKIVIVTSSVPRDELFFGEVPRNISYFIALNNALVSDTENKVTHWIYGSTNKVVDTVIDNINYINNSAFNKKPYWPKRINIDC